MRHGNRLYVSLASPRLAAAQFLNLNADGDGTYELEGDLEELSLPTTLNDPSLGCHRGALVEGALARWHVLP